jgi:hypothetical protein
MNRLMNPDGEVIRLREVIGLAPRYNNRSGQRQRPKQVGMQPWPGGTTSRQVNEMFSKYGTITKVETSRDGAFYVEMSSGADEAIRSLDRHLYEGSTLKVTEFKPGR